MTKTKCPFCGFEDSIEAFKQMRDPWKFRFYTVKMLKCPKCHGIFNYYEGTSPRNKHSVFTIKIKPRRRSIS